MNCPCRCNFLSWALLKLVSITLSTTSRSHTRQFVSISLWAFLSLQEFTRYCSLVANYPEEPTIFQRNPTSFRETHHLSEQPTIFQRNPTSFRATHHLSEQPTIFQSNPSSFRATHHLSEEPTIFQRNPTSFRETHHLSEEPNIFQRNPSSLCVFGFEPEEDIIPIEFGRAWGGSHWPALRLWERLLFVAEWTFSYSCVQARARTSQCMVSSLR